MSTEGQLFSLVVPVLNEEEILQNTRGVLQRTLDGLGMPYEVIVVDNGSTDRTADIMRDICTADARWKYIRLSRNFGYQNSISAAMLAAQGDAIVVIDADLQDPPEMIADFVARWREGYDVVYGVREKRVGESRGRIWLTMLAMRVITWMSDDVKLPLHSGDFRLISRRARDAFAQLPETNRYVRGMIHWLGFRQIGIPYVRRGRTGGRTKSNPLMLIGFTFNAIFNFSIKPLRMFSALGGSLLALTLVLAACHGLFDLGVTVLHLLLLGNLGLTALGVGVLGEYVAKIHAESRRRPLWLVDYTLNLEPSTLSRPIDSASILPAPRSGPPGNNRLGAAA